MPLLVNDHTASYSSAIVDRGCIMRIGASVVTGCTRAAVLLAFGGLVVSVRAAEKPEPPPSPEDYCAVRRVDVAGDTKCQRCRAGYYKESQGDCLPMGDLKIDRSPSVPRNVPQLRFDRNLKRF